jgi:hypothetical protein
MTLQRREIKEGQTKENENDTMNRPNIVTGRARRGCPAKGGNPVVFKNSQTSRVRAAKILRSTSVNGRK